MLGLAFTGRGLKRRACAACAACEERERVCERVIYSERDSEREGERERERDGREGQAYSGRRPPVDEMSVAELRQ